MSVLQTVLQSLAYRASTTTGTLCIGLLLLLVFVWCSKGRRSAGKTPPGPWGLPILGYLPFLSKTVPYVDLFNLHQKYGDVYSFKVPGHNVIVFNTYETVRDAFVKQGDNMIGFPKDFTLIKWLANFAGLGQDGVIWKEQRRFVLRTLKDFGFGRMILEGDIHEATSSILKTLQEHANKPYELKLLVANNAGHVTNKMLYNKTFDMDDPVFATIVEAAHAVNSNEATPGMEAFRPFALFGKYVPIKYLPQFRTLQEAKDRIYDTIESLIKEHEENFDPDNLKDYIDVYLDKLRNIPKDSPEAILYEKKQLAPVLLGMTIGGLDTSSSIVDWAVKLLCLHQDVQRKVQNEIDEVIGRERLPSYADLPHTPYLSAAISEVLRISTLLPVTFYFRSNEEAEIGGYRIPPNSLLLANIYAVHRDARQWKNPEKFDPEHFIGPDGKLKKDAPSMPFFVGKRSCVGEILARMVIYIMITSLFQRFSFRLAEGEPETFDLYLGMTRTLKPYKVIATPRM